MEKDHLKINLKEILNVTGDVKPRKRQAKKIKEKESFIEFIEYYKYANDRTIIMKNEYRVDFINFEEPFVKAIEALLELKFSPPQKSLIEWWLYDKWQLNGEILQLTDEKTGLDIPSDTPEELWDILQQV